MFIRNARNIALQCAHTAGIEYLFGYRFKRSVKMLIGFDDQNFFSGGVNTQLRENIGCHGLGSMLAQNHVDAVFRRCISGCRPDSGEF